MGLKCEATCIKDLKKCKVLALLVLILENPFRLYSEQAAKCSEVAPSGHDLKATSGQANAEVRQECAEVENNQTEGDNKYDFPFAFGYRKIMICKTMLAKHFENITYCSQTSQL